MIFVFALISAAWLVPNHYPPWTAAWGDALAILGLLLLLPAAATGQVSGARISWRLPGIAALCLAVILVQFASGKLVFSGDALLAGFYIGLWLAAVLAGALITSQANQGAGLTALTTTWLGAALLSVGIALVQWTGALSLGIYAADLPPGGRPFANLAQPNHFCTVCFLGLCGLLWLYQARKVNDGVLWLGCGFFLLGMLLSQSRTGWLQIGLLLVWGLVMRARADLRITRRQLLMLGTAFALGVLLLPLVTQALLLSEGRSVGDQMQTGMRLPYWRAMLDAIGRESLTGYGWQQVGAAQQRVALDHPAIGDFFEHGHNLVLDLFLWNGVPVGGVIGTVLVWWFVSHARACRDARVVWLLAAVAGVMAHSLLEYPLDYAYFLIPVGLAMGAIEELSPALNQTLRLPRWSVLAGTVMLGVLFAGIAADYLKAEVNYRTLRMESAHIGADHITTPAPELHLLTQLGAFLAFIHTEATPGMSAQQVDWMRKVSQRFGYPSVLFRYALAAGLNGQPEVARLTLARLCRIHPPQRCVEAREGWAALQARYPQLANIQVPLRE